MTIYRFTWWDLTKDPRHTIVPLGCSVETAAREGEPFQRWEITTDGTEDSNAVKAALEATGYVIGTVAVEALP